MPRVRERIRAWLAPRSFCSSCGHPFHTDRRYPCRCGETARTFARRSGARLALADRIGTPSPPRHPHRGG